MPFARAKCEDHLNLSLLQTPSPSLALVSSSYRQPSSSASRHLRWSIYPYSLVSVAPSSAPKCKHVLLYFKDKARNQSVASFAIYCNHLQVLKYAFLCVLFMAVSSTVIWRWQFWKKKREREM